VVDGVMALGVVARDMLGSLGVEVDFRSSRHRLEPSCLEPSCLEG
jgi:hypothetical protein